MERRNDLLIDMAEDLGRSLMRLIIDDDNDDSETIVVENLTDKDKILIILKKLISQKKYSEGEDVLFQFAEENKPSYLDEVGQWFYGELSFKTENELIEGNFSRREIEQGLKDFQKLIK